MILIYFSLVVIVNGQEIGVKLFIKSSKQQVCFGKSVGVTAKLTNFGDNPIIIDTNQIGYQTTFSWSVSKPKGNEGGASSFIGHDYRENRSNFVVLKPKESFTTNSLFVFNEEFFSKAKKFKMKISYGQFSAKKYENMDIWQGVIDSNEIDIFVNRCKKK